MGGPGLALRDAAFGGPQRVRKMVRATRLHVRSKSRGESVMRGRLTAVIVAVAVEAACAPGASAQSAPTLDYEFFRSRVEPVFLKKRAGHTRCYVCHAESNNAFRLVKLGAGEKTWNDEQSRRNFTMASTLVTPGDAAASRLLMQPLAPEAGGNVFHSGGRQFASKDDPDYRILVQWVSGATPAARSKK